MSERDLDREIAEDMARDEMGRLKAQNAAMLAALKAVHNIALEQVDGGMDAWTEAQAEVEAAIAAAEGTDND